MDHTLDQWLSEEIASFPGKVSLLMTDLESGEVLHSFQPDTVVTSASTIKLPILLTVMEGVQRETFQLQQPVKVPESVILPDTTVFEPENRRETYSLLELLYWMITVSDNTATNVLIDLVGMEAVNGLCHRWGASHTQLQRKMLDFEAKAAGRDNVTTAHDQYVLYAGLHERAESQGGPWTVAMDILLEQRCQDAFLRYLNGPVAVAHKTGGLDHVHHDAGLFLSAKRPYYLGCFTWDGPSLDGQPEQARFLGRIARRIYDCYS